MKRALSVMLITATLLAGCGYNRINIRQVPEKAAPVDERIRAFKDLAPESGLETNYYRNGVQVGTTVNYLMLGDGTRIEDPRDLLGAMEPGTPAVNYVQTYTEKAGTAKTWLTVGWVGIGVGVVAMLIPLVLPHDYSQGTGPLITGIAIGGGIELASLIAYFVGAYSAGQAQLDRVSAFQAYPKSLQKRLALEERDAPGSKSPGNQVKHLLDVPLRVALSP